MSLWVSFLCVNEAGEEDRVSDEEDWGIISYEIPDTVFGVEFDCETSGVANGISRS